jgi:hypothetical protein
MEMEKEWLNGYRNAKIYNQRPDHDYGGENGREEKRKSKGRI